MLTHAHWLIHTGTHHTGGFLRHCSLPPNYPPCLAFSLTDPPIGLARPWIIARLEEAVTGRELSAILVFVDHVLLGGEGWSAESGGTHAQICRNVQCGGLEELESLNVHRTDDNGGKDCVLDTGRVGQSILWNITFNHNFHHDPRPNS
jgi:hypothetical protein